MKICNLEAAARVRSAVHGLPDLDQCLLVLVASHALNDSDATAMIAEEIGMSEAELQAWFGCTLSPEHDPNIGLWAAAITATQEASRDPWHQMAALLEARLLSNPRALLQHFLRTASPEALATLAGEDLPISENTRSSVVATLAARLVHGAGRDITLPRQDGACH